MRRHGGVVAAGDDSVGVGTVEECQQVGEGIPADGQVDAPSSRVGVERVIGLDAIGSEVRSLLVDHLGSLVEELAGLGTARRRVKPATGGKNRVTERLGIKPSQRHPPQQPIVGIDLAWSHVVDHPAVLHVGTADQQPAVQRLEAPSVSDKIGRQPVEQPGVTWHSTAGAEIVAGFHQAGTEMMLPDTIDHHPRRQRMLGRDNPAGQFQATAVVAWQGRVARTGDHLQKSSRRQHARVQPIPATMNRQRHRGRFAGRHHHQRLDPGDLE